MLIRPLITPLVSPSIIPLLGRPSFIPLIRASSGYLHPALRAAFTRASAGWLGPTPLTAFATNVPRINSRGMLMEISRANLFLNSTAPVTQSVTITSAVQSIACYGTGTVTLSGVGTGTLTGTGGSDFDYLSFTPSGAGTLTLTCSGSLSYVGLVAVSYPTSPIITAGTAVTRAAETCWPAFSTLGSPRQFSMWGRMMLPYPTSTAGAVGLWQLDDGTATNSYSITRLGSSPTVRHQRALAGTTVGGTMGSYTPGVEFGYAIAVDIPAGTITASMNGSAANVVSGGPTSGMTTLRFGSTQSAVGQSGGYTGNTTFLPTVLPNSVLQQLST